MAQKDSDSVMYKTVEIDTATPGGTNTVPIRVCYTVDARPGGNGNPPDFLLCDIMVDDLRSIGYRIPAGSPVEINRDHYIQLHGATYIIRAGTPVTATAGNCSSHFRAHRIA